MSGSNKNMSYPKISGSSLVVDDDEDIREILRSFLEGFGQKVEETGDGEIALEMIKNKQYDFIFTDLKMPRISGEHFIKEARKLDIGSAQIVVITGKFLEDIPQWQGDSENQPDAFVRKPFSKSEIYSVLTKGLGRWGMPPDR